MTNNRLQEVKALDTEVNARLTALRDESLQALDTKKTEGLLELENKAHELATECNNKKRVIPPSNHRFKRKKLRIYHSKRR